MKFSVCFILFIPIFCTGQLQLEKIFSDNMILQRDHPVHIWGKANPGKSVTVLFANEKISSTVLKDSAWAVTFKAHKASTQPQSVIIICGDEKTELNNILIGDVWVCIGQSNMEWPVMKEMHYKKEISGSLQPLLRLYNPTYAGKNTFNIPFSDSIVKNLTTENFYKGHWQDCDSNSIKTMSAVAYYFGKKILNEINVPVGLINLSIGGAPLETFISTNTLKNNKQFSAKINGDWLTNEALPVWIRERGRQNVGNNPGIYKDEYGKNHAFKPGFAFESGIAPILNFPVKGVICYQGESNAQEMDRVNEYAALSALMVKEYRSKWKQPQLPFYYVQLSSIDTVKYKGHLWPQFRDEQRKMMDIMSNTGMAVCSDIGFKDDVHPTNKKDVGERLARWALNKTYKKEIIPSGPLPLYAKFKDEKLILQFQYSGSGLQTSDTKPLRGFSVDGKNEIAAAIQNHQVVIALKNKPDFIYYGWKPFSESNLINSEKLPASTFKLKVE